MSANSRHLTLAAESLTGCATRLRNAANRTCMPETERLEALWLARHVESLARGVYAMAPKADAHLADQVRRRAKS